MNTPLSTRSFVRISNYGLGYSDSVGIKVGADVQN